MAARTSDEMAGKVKVLAAAASDVAMTFGATAADIAHVYQAHPTLPEGLKEAALAVSDVGIHT